MERNKNMPKDGILKIACTAANRAVFLNGEYLPLEPSLKVLYSSPEGFNWGYMGSGPKQLALAILLHVLDDKDEVLRYYKTFLAVFVANFPQGSWDGELLVGDFLSYVRNSEKIGIHAYDLIRINLDPKKFGVLDAEPVQISKFLDFPYLPYRTAVLGAGTKEYDLLEKIPDNAWRTFAAYVEQSTTRKNALGQNVSASVGNFPTPEYRYLNGMGTQTYTGFVNHKRKSKNGKA